MDHTAVVNKIIKYETESSGKCNNVLGVIASALYGMISCPLCCCFCCGCCGKFPAAPMVPNDEDINDSMRKLSPEERRLTNCESHLLAVSLGCTPCSLLSACVCCGLCGRCGPYTTAKAVAIANSEH